MYRVKLLILLLAQSMPGALQVILAIFDDFWRFFRG